MKFRRRGCRILRRIVPVIDIAYGRVILINTSNEENQLRLVFGIQRGAEMRRAFNSTLAIEVERQYVPGRGSAKSLKLPRLYVPNGGVEWQDTSGHHESRKCVAVDDHRWCHVGSRGRLFAAMDRPGACRPAKRAARRVPPSWKTRGLHKPPTFNCWNSFKATGVKK